MKNIAVFASGFGSNLQAIIKAIKQGRLDANLALVVSDKKDAYALKRAKRAGIKTLLLEPAKFPSREAFEDEVLKALKEEKVELVVLAGFMRIIGKVLLENFPNRILNIHPALLPAFKGSWGIRDAFEYGVKITGVTVHIVDDKMDHGPIILQGVIKIATKDTLESLEKRIHRLEHKLYPAAIQVMLSGKIKVEGRKVVI
ncbi:MAG: phosphoribosylglycinamide formyltransferase [Candidatus Omnitrophota bacterium]